jgi:ABC-type transport system involved in cytochrome c biogenesis permease subunit
MRNHREWSPDCYPDSPGSITIITKTMHETGVFWLRVATALYAVGLLHALLMLFRKKPDIFRVALGAFAIGVVVHIVAVVELTMAIGKFPVDNFFETFSLCALLVGIAFLFVYWKYRFESLSIFVFPLIFVMTLVGSMETPVASWPDPSLRDGWLLVHIVMILLGYASLLLTAIASIFYLIRERQLKHKVASASSIFDRLPPLGTLDTIVTNSMSFGFVFITLGVIAGSAWAFIESGTSWIEEPKIAISLVTWAFYLLMVFLRATAGWRGRKAALMAITVLCCSALTWAAHVGLRSFLEK